MECEYYRSLDGVGSVLFMIRIFFSKFNIKTKPFLMVQK